MADPVDTRKILLNMNGKIDKEIEEVIKQGAVKSSNWEAYTWKNELLKQRELVSKCLMEILSEAETEHNPLHTIELAIGVTALCMRRLIECRLVTDQFQNSKLKIYCVPRNSNHEWREPFICNTAGNIFRNYDLSRRVTDKQSPKWISDKLLHARVIAVNVGSSYLPDGLLVASDKQRKNNLFHFSPAEFSELLNNFLDDKVLSTTDGFEKIDGKIQTKKVIATRD